MKNSLKIELKKEELIYLNIKGGLHNMTVKTYLAMSDIETKLLFSWSCNVACSEQLELQQKFSSLSDFNIGEFYHILPTHYSEIYEYKVVSQKICDDGTVLLLVEV